LENGRFTRSQPGYVGSDGRFARFATEADGARAQEQLLARSYLGNGPRSVRQIIDRYTPPHPENPPAARANYIRYVERRLGIRPGQPVTQAQVSALAQAMREFETGRTVR
jgi:hypothetical protein